MQHRRELYSGPNLEELPATQQGAGFSRVRVPSLHLTRNAQEALLRTRGRHVYSCQDRGGQDSCRVRVPRYSVLAELSALRWRLLPRTIFVHRLSQTKYVVLKCLVTCRMTFDPSWLLYVACQGALVCLLVCKHVCMRVCVWRQSAPDHGMLGRCVSFFHD